MRHHAGGRIDREGGDLLRRVVRDLLDVHAALGRDHEGDPAGVAVDQHRQVELLRDVGALLDIQPVHLLAGRAGLRRHQRAAEHLGGMRLDLLDRAGQPHAALVAGLRLPEPALAAAARMDLRLDHEDRPAKLARRRRRLLGAKIATPRDTGTPNSRKTALPWYSWMFIACLSV